LGLGFWAFGVAVLGLGIRVWGFRPLGFGLWVWAFEVRVWAFGFGVLDLWGSGFGFGPRVLGLGIRVWGLGPMGLGFGPLGFAELCLVRPFVRSFVRPAYLVHYIGDATLTN